MQKILFLAITFTVLTSGYAVAGNYILTIDGKKYEVDLDKKTTIMLFDGKKIQVSLEKKAIISFETKNFSFDHPGNITPSRKDVSDGIFQTTMTSPLGTLVLVQEYENIDPASTVDTMLNELTKEEKQYGYKITNSPAEVKLVGGKALKGKKSIAIYKGKETTRYVLCYSIRDGGVMVIIQINKDAPSEDRAMIDLFWRTFKLLLK
jgi:hypothetical protein